MSFFFFLSHPSFVYPLFGWMMIHWTQMMFSIIAPVGCCLAKLSLSGVQVARCP